MAIMSTAAFIAIIFSVLFTFVWVNYQLRITPEIEGYAEFTWVNSRDAVLTITVRLVRGTPVEFTKVVLPTDNGLVEITGPGTYTVNQSLLTVRFEGFEDSLFTGQQGKIVIEIIDANQIYTRGKEYRGIVDFEGVTIVYAFQP